MKFDTSTKQSADFERVHIPEGFYVGQLKEVKPISEGQYGNRCAWIYEVEADGKKVELPYVCYCDDPATEQNKLGKAFVAHGVDIDDKEKTTDPLEGTEARVLVESYEYEDDDGKTKKASTINKVKSVKESKTEAKTEKVKK